MVKILETVVVAELMLVVLAAAPFPIFKFLKFQAVEPPKLPVP